MSEPDDKAFASMSDDLVQAGSWGKVCYAKDKNDDMPAKEFVEGLKDSDKASLAVLFERMANTGQIHNREQFKKIEGDLFEFKRHQTRVGCFRDGNVWFLTHGFKKKRNKWKRSDVERGIRIMQEHRQRQASRGNDG